VRASRVVDAPIIAPPMLPGEEGASINGPSLIRVPDWAPNRLGRYYLYFAHHAGTYIRLAYADRLEGPWKIHGGGVLDLDAQTTVVGHVASPQVIIDDANRRFYLFYHGDNPRKKQMGIDGDVEGGQLTGVAQSEDGLGFVSLERVVGPAYLQVFSHRGRWFGINQSGVLREAKTLGEPFEPIAKIIGPDSSRRGGSGASWRTGRGARGAAADEGAVPLRDSACRRGRLGRSPGGVFLVCRPPAGADPLHGGRSARGAGDVAGAECS